MLLNGNSIQNYFIKLLIKPGIDLFLSRIKSLVKVCALASRIKWQLMPSVLPETTIIFTYSRLLVYNQFHILRHFSKLGTSQSLTDVNKYRHLTLLCNLIYTIYTPYATQLILISLFFKKHFP